ncbi:hypothetical protein [Falsiroseomonas sp. E2-1-a20]|uniref:hypothetical protein n=1 Tax=Falsiroseomonas sp. E2-1-a20 TaxID=3239300 RepID=UPI003F3B41D7
MAKRNAPAGASGSASTTSVHGYDMVAFDPRNCRAEMGGKVLLVEVDNEKSCGKTTVADLIMSEIERRVRGGVPSVMFHLHEVESARRLGGKYDQIYSTGFDKIVAEARVDAVQLPMPSLRAHLQRRVPVFLDTGANTFATVNGVLEMMQRSEIAKFVRVRIVIVPANRDAITSALNIVGPLTAADDIRRVIIVQNFNDEDMALVDKNLRERLDEQVRRVMAGGGMAIRMPWCAQVPKDGFVDSFGQLIGSGYREVLGITEALRRIEEEEDTMSEAENEELTLKVFAALKIHEWAKRVMSDVAAPIVDRLEQLHGDLECKLFDPKAVRREFIPGSAEGAGKAA